MNEESFCKYCKQPIQLGGKKTSSWFHPYTGLHSCDPALTGEPYGLSAEPHLCRVCRRTVEPCAQGWHEDVCHSHSLTVGDYLCGSWLKELEPRT